ncbi:polysaccharide deacetylase family protein [Methylomonas sp. 2BW1-5-20]|uniref:polysaccharide deacetylase family protein n=1 Tax=Methylomonas sp. 2BW1-5-20 TaxID=3376686 RepID=UPI00404C0FA3
MMNFSAYRNWQPTPLMKASFLLTIATLAAIAIHPAIWPWALAVVVADHLLLTFAGLWPRCSWVGSNWTSLPPAATERGEIAITIDDGPDPEITPAVLDVLDRYGAKATFFCIADKAQRYPALCRDIVRRGHAVENHSMHHQYHLPFLLLGGWMAELNAAQDALTKVTGIRPRFFRPPVGLRNPLLDPVLSRLNLQLASWTRRGFDTVERNPQVVLAKLLKDLKAGDILLLHDSNVAHSSTGQPVILEVLPPLLDAIATAKLRTVTLGESLDRCRQTSC